MQESANFRMTTHIGKYLLNHSFMLPGLIGVGVSTTVGYLIA